MPDNYNDKISQARCLLLEVYIPGKIFTENILILLVTRNESHYATLLGLNRLLIEVQK